MSDSTFIGTSNRGFAQQAQEELRRLLGQSVKFEWLAPGEVFVFTSEFERSDAIGRILAQEPVFLRHIQPVDVEQLWDGSFDHAIRHIHEMLVARGASLKQMNVAVQARKAEGEALASLSLPTVRSSVEEMLATVEANPVSRDADFILSLYFTEVKLYFGLSRPQDNLSDWSGGAIRFRKEEGQVSRAKFKLLEAEQAFGLDLSQYRAALDIGAAPGGWTSLLLERGLRVTAIDPAKLDAALLRHPQLTYFPKKADEVSFAANTFDLLVCDMSWSHRQMARLVRGLLGALQPGGTAVITVKLMHKKAFQTIREVVSDLAPELELQQAKQLFHNREELTLFLMKQV
ncbi:23S rRNA (cytidine2498-2'-O)-methyltransferase [Paenibacillus tianmuensis]|uniref:23S rRNA (Cytidine2498-2'-O)-methyltransferase n=1 Tax=Paenibacillus tianmuensis TaxID=624147 RepID=A0A1G4RTE2_9BACL|nr:SAM-dependent methyltransferase [Paenibacillus tianmuensis]SCW60144.1 23S rRNA (cytidine2498-2'-O)-methyltransferase [Paenibacillus tianmuensis]